MKNAGEVGDDDEVVAPPRDAADIVGPPARADARHGLRDKRLTIRHVGGAIEQRYLSADEIEAALADTFLLTPEPGWRRAIERAATAEVQA